MNNFYSKKTLCTLLNIKGHFWHQWLDEEPFTFHLVKDLEKNVLLGMVQ